MLMPESRMGISRAGQKHLTPWVSTFRGLTKMGQMFCTLSVPSQRRGASHLSLPQLRISGEKQIHLGVTHTSGPGVVGAVDHFWDTAESHPEMRPSSIHGASLRMAQV